jgi:hypothetical protein
MDPPIRIRIHTKMSWIRNIDPVFVVQACAEKVGQVQVDCGLLQPVGDYVESFNFGLVEVSCLRGMTPSSGLYFLQINLRT